jgi:hypothetical protein
MVQPSQTGWTKISPGANWFESMFNPTSVAVESDAVRLVLPKYCAT